MISSTIAPGSLSTTREAVLIALQAGQVLFLAVHDWVPLGRLNDVAAVRSQDTTTRLLVVRRSRRRPSPTACSTAS